MSSDCGQTSPGGNRPTGESLLQLRAITKRFAGVAALQEVSLTLRRGHILALVGQNGAGKSTLMKILSGVYRPDAGEIFLDGQRVNLRNPQDAQALGVSIIYQEFSLVPYLSVVENLFLGRERTNRVGACAKAKMDWEAQGILDRLGAKFGRWELVARLSVAEQQFVEIGKALLRKTRILIMDEPSATLTPEEVKRLFALMRELVEQGISIIFISHHLDEVFSIADDILCLRDGRVAGERRATGCSHDDLIRLMVGRDIAQTFPPKAARVGPYKLKVLELQRKPHLPTVSFHVCEGEVLGIAGLVGSGRTKMIRALTGAERALRHNVCLSNERLKVRTPADSRAVGIGLAPEDRKFQGLIVEAPIKDNVLLTNFKKVCRPFLGILNPAAAENATRVQLEALKINARSSAQVVNTLSGGNQQKIVLAKWLHAGCQILIFDEPTRGIDVGAKAEIYKLMRELANQGLGIIMISSDLPEIIGMSDRILVMRGQGIQHEFGPGEAVSEETILAYAAGANRG